MLHLRDRSSSANIYEPRKSTIMVASNIKAKELLAVQHSNSKLLDMKDLELPIEQEGQRKLSEPSKRHAGKSIVELGTPTALRRIQIVVLLYRSALNSLPWPHSLRTTITPFAGPTHKPATSNHRVAVTHWCQTTVTGISRLLAAIVRSLPRIKAATASSHWPRLMRFIVIRDYGAVDWPTGRLDGVVAKVWERSEAVLRWETWWESIH